MSYARLERLINNASRMAVSAGFSRGDRLLAQNWLARAHEFEREMNVIRDSIARVDEIATNFEQATKVAAE